MKKQMMMVLFGGLVGMLAGCEPSAQEKLAQEQLKALEQQKIMQKAMAEAFEKNAADAQAQLEALRPIGQEKRVYKKFDLYPPKK